MQEPAVPREEVRKFCAACASLDAGVIAALLEEKIGAAEWQRRLKALSLVEALIKEEDASGTSTKPEDGTGEKEDKQEGGDTAQKEEWAKAIMAEDAVGSAAATSRWGAARSASAASRLASCSRATCTP